jgi:hypothetical protein
MRYQIGNAQRPEASDPRFETENEALNAARLRCTGDQVYAVWHWTSDKEYAETRFLVYQGDVWKPA